MNIARVMLKADYVGVRELKAHLFGLLKGKKPLIVTEHGTPQNVILPYEDMMEMVDILDELQDPETLRVIQEGRRAIKRGAKGRLVSKLFAKIRARNK